MRWLTAPLFLLLALAAGPAGAGDVARLEVAGFSPDGRFFAFEQYGEAAGTGAPWSEIVLIDVPANAWAGGTPVREVHRGEADFPTLAAVRQRVADEAAPALRNAGIARGTGRAVLLHPPTDLDADPHAARFTDIPFSGPGYRLVLEERPAAAAPCGIEGEIPRLLTLTLTDEFDGAEQVLQQDERLPASRGCALGYGIDRVYVHNTGPGASGALALVVLVRVMQPGFEGPDVRYLAISGLVAR